jgi:alpha-glucosidase
MQWTARPGAGFSTAKPWLPLSKDHEHANVETLRAEPRSILSLYHRLTELRRAHAALRIGDLMLLPATEHVLAYERFLDGERMLVALNLGTGEETIQTGREGRLVLSTYMDQDEHPVPATLTLRPDEGVLVSV